MHQNRLRLVRGSTPDPTGGSLQRSTRPRAVRGERRREEREQGGKGSLRFLPLYTVTTKNEEDRTIVNLTLILKVSCQGHVINFGLFEITDLELVRIDTKIKSVSCIQPKITKVT